MAEAPPLTYEQTARLVLSKLQNLEHPIVLIGGQAVNFWANYYLNRLSPALTARAPFASKDIDFCGTRAAVTECARRLGGQARLATLDDATPNTGVVSFVDDEGVERTIDFLGHPGGLDAEETVRMSIGAEIDVEGLPQPLTFRVMHPVQCLESRAFNVAKLPGYDTEHSLDQLRAAIACAREFLVDLLAEPDNVRTVLKLNERIFALAAYKAGLDVFATKGIDVLGAIVVDPRLPQAFREKRYPQIREVVAQRRARHGTSGRDRG